jgi:hypothetical protein
MKITQNNTSRIRRILTYLKECSKPKIGSTYLPDSQNIDLPHRKTGNVELVDEDALVRVDLAKPYERNVLRIHSAKR